MYCLLTEFNILFTALWLIVKRTPSHYTEIYDSRLRWWLLNLSWLFFFSAKYIANLAKDLLITLKYMHIWQLTVFNTKSEKTAYLGELALQTNRTFSHLSHLVLTWIFSYDFKYRSCWQIKMKYIWNQQIFKLGYSYRRLSASKKMTVSKPRRWTTTIWIYSFAKQIIS